MQTFVPDSDYSISAACLDNKRLGKQRLECKQILLALGVAIGPHSPGKKGWQNHPAVRMWQGAEYELCLYGLDMCREWRDTRKFNDTLGEQFLAVLEKLPETPKPAWLGDERVHASHRSNLLRKDKEFYGKFEWAEPDDLPYFWPV
jgi:hypothetical protein